MTFDEQIYAAVKDASRTGLTAGQITFPLLNMVASTIANVVVHGNLSPDAELEVIRHELDKLYVRYLEAYRKQPA